MKVNVYPRPDFKDTHRLDFGIPVKYLGKDPQAALNQLMMAIGEKQGRHSELADWLMSQAEIDDKILYYRKLYNQLVKEHAKKSKELPDGTRMLKDKDDLEHESNAMKDLYQMIKDYRKQLAAKSIREYYSADGKKVNQEGRRVKAKLPLFGIEYMRDPDAQGLGDEVRFSVPFGVPMRNFLNDLLPGVGKDTEFVSVNNMNGPVEYDSATFEENIPLDLPRILNKALRLQDFSREGLGMKASDYNATMGRWLGKNFPQIRNLNAPEYSMSPEEWNRYWKQRRLDVEDWNLREGTGFDSPYELDAYLEKESKMTQPRVTAMGKKLGKMVEEGVLPAEVAEQYKQMVRYAEELGMSPREVSMQLLPLWKRVGGVTEGQKKRMQHELDKKNIERTNMISDLAKQKNELLRRIYNARTTGDKLLEEQLRPQYRSIGDKLVAAQREQSVNQLLSDDLLHNAIDKEGVDAAKAWQDAVSRNGEIRRGYNNFLKNMSKGKDTPLGPLGRIGKLGMTPEEISKYMPGEKWLRWADDVREAFPGEKTRVGETVGLEALAHKHLAPVLQAMGADTSDWVLSDAEQEKMKEISERLAAKKAMLKKHKEAQKIYGQLDLFDSVYERMLDRAEEKRKAEKDNAERGGVTVLREGKKLVPQKPAPAPAPAPAAEERAMPEEFQATDDYTRLLKDLSEGNPDSVFGNLSVFKSLIKSPQDYSGVLGREDFEKLNDKRVKLFGGGEKKGLDAFPFINMNSVYAKMSGGIPPKTWGVSSEELADYNKAVDRYLYGEEMDYDDPENDFLKYTPPVKQAEEEGSGAYKETPEDRAKEQKAAEDRKEQARYENALKEPAAKNNKVTVHVKKKPKEDDTVSDGTLKNIIAAFDTRGFM